MAVKGPLGIPRPFAKEVEAVRIDVFQGPVGPLGGPRPFAKGNPGWGDEEDY